MLVLDLVKQTERREREVIVGREYRRAVEHVNSTMPPVSVLSLPAPRYVFPATCIMYTAKRNNMVCGRTCLYSAKHWPKYTDLLFCFNGYLLTQLEGTVVHDVSRVRIVGEKYKRRTVVDPFVTVFKYQPRLTQSKRISQHLSSMLLRH